MGCGNEDSDGDAWQVKIYCSLLFSFFIISYSLLTNVKYMKQDVETLAGQSQSTLKTFENSLTSMVLNQSIVPFSKCWLPEQRYTRLGFSSQCYFYAFITLWQKYSQLRNRHHDISTEEEILIRNMCIKFDTKEMKSIITILDTKFE